MNKKKIYIAPKAIVAPLECDMLLAASHHNNHSIHMNNHYDQSGAVDQFSSSSSIFDDKIWDE